jgi:hypothetical protein
LARIRTIKPEFWRHEDLCQQPEATHMFAAALLNYADDTGYFNANPGLIKGEIYPLREPSVSIPESLRSLQTIGYIRLGTGPDGRRYGHISHFDQHQRVSHPTPSKISILAIAWDDIATAPENIVKPPETFAPERNREQGTGKGKEQGILPDKSGVPKSKKYPDDFEEFWKAYPTDANMSKKAAAKQWARLDPDRRRQAVAAIPAFKAYCAQNHDWYRPIYAERFLSEEKFEGFLAATVIRSTAFNSPEEIEAQRRQYEEAYGKKAPY